MANRIRLLRIFALSLLLLASLFPVQDHAQTASVSYTYDKSGRVAGAIYASGACVVYSYDANSNRALQSNIVTGTPQSPKWGTGVWGCFSWTP